jgi:hypothetical protein
VLSDVGTDGWQISRISALLLLLAHPHPERRLTLEEAAAIDALKET